MDLSRLRLRSPWAPDRRRIGLTADESGASAVEFALLLPVLCFLLFGIVKLGIVLNNYVQLTNATAAGERQLSIDRSNAATTTTPYTDTMNAVYNAAPNLTHASITSTLTVAGTACSTDATCKTALDGSTAGTNSSLRLTYPCNLTIYTIVVASCSLTYTSAGAVQ